MPKQGDNKGIDPRAVFERAMAMPDFTPDEMASFNTLRAREMARAEARRDPPSPQLDLDMAA